MTKRSTTLASTVDQVCTWCVGMPGATLDHTFGLDTDVYRIGDKIFAMINTGDPGFVTLKARPIDVDALLARYGFARRGYYMNKQHWVTLDFVDDVPMDEIRQLVGDSYQLVLSSFSKKRQAELSGI